MRTPSAVADAFRSLYGRQPEGVWQAPGRANLIGEFTDYNDGHVLPFALPWASLAAVARRDDDLVRVFSAQRPSAAGHPAAARLGALVPGVSNGWTSYVQGVTWALAQAADGLFGADIYLDSDVPIGVGLSSSAALECSVALSLRDLYGLSLTNVQLAAVARRVENEYVGVPTGIMDQSASLCCADGRALLIDTRSLEMRQVPLDIDAAGLALLVVNTGIARSLTSSAYAERRRDCLRAAAELGVHALRDVAFDRLDASLAQIADPLARRRARHVVSEDARVLEVVRLLESGRLAEIGPVLTAGHRSLCEDFEVSTDEINLVVDTALANGALGARMSGGGFGGAVLVLVESAEAGRVEQAIRRACITILPARPGITAVTACAGASRVI